MATYYPTVNASHIALNFRNVYTQPQPIGTPNNLSNSVFDPSYYQGIAIIAVQIGYPTKDATPATYRLEWRNVTANTAWYNVLAGPAQVCYTSALNILTDGQAVTSAQSICGTWGSYTYVNGVQNTGDNSCTCPDLASNEYTELQFALDLTGTVVGNLYQFRLYNVTSGASAGTLLATIRIMISPVGAMPSQGKVLHRTLKNPAGALTYSGTLDKTARYHTDYEKPINHNFPSPSGEVTKDYQRLAAKEQLIDHSFPSASGTEIVTAWLNKGLGTSGLPLSGKVNRIIPCNINGVFSPTGPISANVPQKVVAGAYTKDVGDANISSAGELDPPHLITVSKKEKELLRNLTSPAGVETITAWLDKGLSNSSLQFAGDVEYVKFQANSIPVDVDGEFNASGDIDLEATLYVDQTEKVVSASGDLQYTKQKVVVKDGILASSGIANKFLRVSTSGVLTPSGRGWPVMRKPVSGDLTSEGQSTHIPVKSLRGQLFSDGQVTNAFTRTVSGGLVTSGECGKTVNIKSSGIAVTVGSTIYPSLLTFTEKQVDGGLEYFGEVIVQPPETAQVFDEYNYTELYLTDENGNHLTDQDGNYLTSILQNVVAEVSCSQPTLDFSVKRSVDVFGTSQYAGSVSKSIQRAVNVSGNLVPAGKVIRLLARTIDGTLSTSGAVVRGIVLSGNLTSSSEIRRDVGVVNTGDFQPAPGLEKHVHFEAGGNLYTIDFRRTFRLSGDFERTVEWHVNFDGSLSYEATLEKVTAYVRELVGKLDSSGDLQTAHHGQIELDGSTDFSGKLVKRISEVITGALISGGSVDKTFIRDLVSSATAETLTSIVTISVNRDLSNSATAVTSLSSPGLTTLTGTGYVITLTSRGTNYRKVDLAA